MESEATLKPAQPRHGVILLAAGASRRLGSPKQLLRLRGEPLVRRAARLALATRPADAVVVLGAREADVRAVLDGLPLRAVVCAAWAEGMGRSLAEGLAALEERCAGALVVLCDQAGLGEAHLLRLRDAWRLRPFLPVASGYAGVVGVPAFLPRALFAELSTCRTGGARELLRGRPDVIAIQDEALAVDVDLPEDVPASGSEGLES